MKTLLLIAISIALGGYYYSEDLKQYADQHADILRLFALQQSQDNQSNQEKPLEGIGRFKAHSQQMNLGAILENSKDNPNGMTIHELAKCRDRDCMDQFREGNTKLERTEADKLMNFFARGKYE